MHTRYSRAAAAVLLLCSAGPLGAAELETERFYAGVGISTNDLDGDDASGQQIFLGYELPVALGEAEPALEVGFHQAGDFRVGPRFRRTERDIAGVWTNAVVSVPLTERVDLLGRAGIDFGDDDGLMAGGGVGVDLSRDFELRGEYVVRDETDSLQANLLYRF